MGFKNRYYLVDSKKVKVIYRNIQGADEAEMEMFWTNNENYFECVGNIYIVDLKKVHEIGEFEVDSYIILSRMG